MKNKILISIITSLLFAQSVSAFDIIVKREDSLSKLAKQYNTSINEIATNNNIKNKNLILSGQKLSIGQSQGEIVLGANPVTNSGGYMPITAYSSRTSQYVTLSATTIPVASTLDKQGNQIVLANISSAAIVKVYMSLGAGTSTEEPVMCTGLTSVSWTGCTRGLRDQSGDETGSSTLAFAHNAGTSIIITNIGQFYNQFLSIDGNQTINDQKIFSSIPFIPTSTPIDPRQAVSLYQIQQATSTGGINNSPTTKGVCQIATQAQIAAGTVTGTTGAYLCVPSQFTSSTGGVATTTIPVTNSSGKLISAWGGSASTLATLDANTLVVQNPANASTTPGAGLIPIADASGNLYGWGSRFGGNGTDGALTINNTSTVINLGGAKAVEKNYTSISITSTGTLSFSNPAIGGTIVTLKSRGGVTITCSSAPCIDLRGIGASGGNTALSAGTLGNGILTPTLVHNAPSHAAGTGGVGGVVMPSSTPYLVDAFGLNSKSSLLAVGSGGAGGAGVGFGSGGRGGGALLIESAGLLNFTTASGINCSGSAGAAASVTANSGGGGGGAAGMCAIAYNYLTSASGTILASGGAGGLSPFDIGAGSCSGGGGAGSIYGAGGAGGSDGGAGNNGTGLGAGGGGGACKSSSGSAGGTGGGSMGGFVTTNTVWY